MPFREQELVRYCGQCEEEATTACLRCGRPSCKPHAPASNARCNPCETHYQQIETRFAPSTALTISVGAGSALAIIAAPVIIMGGAALGATLGLAFLGGWWAALAGLLGYVGACVLFKKSHDALFGDEQVKRRALRRCRRHFLKERQHLLEE